jgi:hypothetical protein
VKSVERKLLGETICKSIVLDALTSLIEKKQKLEGVAESTDTNLLYLYTTKCKKKNLLKLLFVLLLL